MIKRFLADVLTHGESIDYCLVSVRFSVQNKNERSIMAKIHEQTIEEHVKNNVESAIEQADAYGGLREAFFSFLQNTVDSCIGDGYSPEFAFDAGSLFCAEFNKTAGTSF